MGIKTHQLGSRKKNPKESKKIELGKKRRLNEWYKWWH